MNFLGRVGFAFEVGSFDAYVGADVSLQTSGGDIEGVGAGVGLGYGDFAARGGIMANASGVNPSFSGGLNMPLNTSVGFSLSSQGGFTTNFQVVGFGSHTMSTVGSGWSWSYSYDRSVPIYWFTINLATSEWGWLLDETYLDYSYGYLYQSNYLTDPRRFSPVTPDEPIISNKKYERMEHGSQLYPSQDIYLVASQGLNGVFKPFMRKMFHLQDDLRFIEDRIEGEQVIDDNGQLKSIEGIGVNSRDDAVFRFLGDGGANFITTSLPDRSGSIYDYEPVFSERYGGRRIEPAYDPVNYKIIGFRIIDSDGTQYEFMQPVMEWLEYTWSNQTTSQRIGNQYVENTLRSNRILGSPYASNWLLTAIKGPDYVDRDQNDKANDGDWGYWVTFVYRKASRPQIWRSPYVRMGPGATSKDIETASIGLRDMVLLEHIETASHVAIFFKTDRKDRKTPSLVEEEIRFPGKLESKTDNGQSQTYVYRFPGDWRGDYQNIPEDKEFLVLTYSFPWELSGYHLRAIDRKLPLSKALQGVTQILEGLESGVSADWTIDYDGYDTIFTINIVTGNEIAVYEAHIVVEQFFQGSYSDAQKLERIELYSKADPHVSSSDLDSSWSVHPGATRLKSVKFDYDYSLCPHTPNSLATQDDGAPGGKLTLKSVELLGKNHANSVIPPYRFVYANGALPGTELNPAYHEHNWDNWGSYRSPVSGQGKYVHQTPQEKSAADMAAAWSLTEIVTPTGGSVHIAYESDDYYYVGDYIDFVKFNHSTDSGNSLEKIAYQIRKHGTEDNTVLLGNMSSYHPNNYSNIREEFADEVGLVQGRYIAIIEAMPSNNNYGWPAKVTVRQITQVNVHERLVPSAGRFVKQFGGYVIKFSGDPFPFDVNDDTHKYFIKLYPRKNYGGGVRVKSITTTDGIQSYKTVYSYQTADGLSTGVTASLPSLYEEAKYLFQELDSAEKLKNTGFYIHENPNLPAPNVLYSQVEVMNVNENGTLQNGKTVFEFMTARDFPFSATNLSFRSIGDRNDDRRGNEIARLIDDRSGIYGLPKAITFYELTSYQSLRKVRTQETFYAFSDSLHQHGNISKNGVDENNPRSPLGLIYERHRFENDWKFVSHPYRKKRILFMNGDITKLFQNVYVIGNRMTTYDYVSPTHVRVAGSLTRESSNFLWDALGGHVIGSAKDQSDGRVMIAQLVPAHWKYPGMRNKNMLTQLAQETTYISESVNFSECYGAFKQYTFSPTEIMTSKITTWFDWGNNVWRKNDTYVYNKKIDRSDGEYHPFNNWSYSLDTYPVVSASEPWHMTSNITKYNENSHPIEESHTDRTYSSAVYGHGGALPVAIARNARFRESYYLDFESEEGLNTLGTVSAFFTGSGEGRTGKAFKASTSAGPWYNLDGLKKQTVYLITFWAKRGSANLSHRIRFFFSGPGMAGGGIPILKTLQTGDQWEYFEFQFIPLDHGTVEMHLDLDNVPGTGGMWHYVDDLRIHPLDATMRTFAYDPLTRQVTSITDENNISAYFEYDDFGRLVRVRDQDRNLLSTYAYHYGPERLIPRGTPSPRDLLRDRFSRSFLQDRLNDRLVLSSLGFDLILNNYIRRQSIVTPITSESDISRLADHELIQTITYYDGFGKAAQSIAIKGSPSKKDIVTPVEYNELGLQTKSYLPYAANTNTGEYHPGDLKEQRAFYQSTPNVPHTEYPFAETVHEKSPLLRVKEQGYAGKPWQPTGRTPTSGHTIKTKYRANEANELRLWKWNGAAFRFQADGFYAAGQLVEHFVSSC